MAEINGGVIAARQLKKSGIDTFFGVVAGPIDRKSVRERV
jgi:hypothetical protein